MKNLRHRLGMSTIEMGKALAEELNRPKAIAASKISQWELGYHMPGADVYLAVLDIAELAGDITNVVEGKTPLPRTQDPKVAAMMREMSEIRSLVTTIAEGKYRRLNLPPAEGPTSEYVSTREAAEVLSVSHGTIYNRIGQGRIAAYRLGSQTVIKRRDLAKLRNGSS